MITVVRHHNCGTIRARQERIPYDLQKGEVASRITEALDEGRNYFVAEDLGRLASGSLAEDKLLALFTPDEIRAALQKRIGALATEVDAIQSLMGRLPGGPSGVAGGAARAMFGGPNEDED